MHGWQLGLLLLIFLCEELETSDSFPFSSRPFPRFYCVSTVNFYSLNTCSRSSGSRRKIVRIDLKMLDDEDKRCPPTEKDALLSSSEKSQAIELTDDNDIENGLITRQQSQLSSNTTTGTKILQLAIPAAGALLIDPLMTLADTAFVGRFSDSPEQLAGMGSAAPLLTFSFYLFNFLCTATTPLVASKRAAGLEGQAQAVGGQALSLALALGGFLSLLLISFKQILLTVMGTGITGDEANGYALAFLSVRALAAPAVLSIEASTGVLRGYLDTKTPIVVLVVANVINLVLDIFLIAFLGLGPMGAAIATTTAEWISAGLFLGVLAGFLPSASGELGKNHRNSQGSIVSILPLAAIPSWEEIRPLIVASSSVFLRTIVLQFSISAAAAMAARGDNAQVGAAAAVAAHQIAFQLWLLCSFFCDSLAAASQGLVADGLGRNDAAHVRDVSKTVFLYSLILGLVLAALLQIGNSSGILYGIFTEDPAIKSALSEILPLIVLAQPLNALVFAADGVLQGASEFPYQARAMLISGVAAVSTFFVLEAETANVDTLVHVWVALIALQSMRGATSLWKIVQRDGPIDILARKVPS